MKESMAKFDWHCTVERKTNTAIPVAVVYFIVDNVSCTDTPYKIVQSLLEDRSTTPESSQS